jgi:phosphohistidine phosphatase
MYVVEIHLIRHADAEDQRPGQLDAERKLTDKGWRQSGWLASTLEALGIKYHTLVTSPLRRARDTGYTLEHLADRLEVDELLANPPDAQILDFLGALEVSLEPLPSSGPIALIGHQPYLGELIALMLCGDTALGRSFEVKKAALYALEWSGEHGGRLKYVVTPDLTRHIGQGQ